MDGVANELIQSATEAGIGHCKGNTQWEEEEVRMTQINCKPWHFNEGDITAIAILFDTVRRPDTNSLQHLIFRGDWYPDDPNIAEKHPELLFENLQFCGENPDHCVNKATLAYKMYMVIVNQGWMPEKYLYVEVVGWLILIGMFGLAFFGVYKLLRWLPKTSKPSEYEVVSISEANEV